MAKQLRIAVVGKTGNGKSSVANSIIGKNVFKTGLSTNRVTKVTSSSRTKRLSGQDIVVFDTPGLYQEGEDESEIRKEIEKSIVSPGLHAVVFVIKSGCFTKEEQEAVEQMKTLFGTSIFRFTIFAFTCINDLGMQSLEGFVHKSAPAYLKDVIRRSGFRIVGFDNRDKIKDEESLTNIISLVANMSKTNKECLYSCELFEEAFQEQKERQLEFEMATAEKEAAIQKKHEEDCNTIAEKQDQITSEQQQYLRETAQREKQSIGRENSESLGEMEENVKSGTNYLRDDMNLKTRVASDTQLEAKRILRDSADPQHFKGENRPTNSGNDECFVAKEVEIASDMDLSVTVNVAGRDVRDTEVAGLGLHAEESRTGDVVSRSGLHTGVRQTRREVNFGSALQLQKLMSKSQTAWNQLLKMMRRSIKRGEEYDIPPNEVRLVLIGKSGNGKSSTANTILGEDICKIGATATSITKKTDTYRASRFGKEILLVDTPGLFDPEIEREETENEISKCMCMTFPGFHAFLLVVRVGRFTAEEMNTVKEFEKLFGEKLYDFMIIVFTRTDDLVRENKELEDFVRRDIPPELKLILERCKNRYVGLNNTDSTANKEIAAMNLLKKIEKMMHSKHPKYYTNEAFEKAEKVLRETIEAEKERMKAANKALFEEMFLEKEKKMNEKHDIKMKKMMDGWEKERKQQEETAKIIREEEKEAMKKHFNVEMVAMMAKEKERREELLKQQREESEKAIQGIKDDNVMFVNDLKVKVELEKEEAKERVARKEGEDKVMNATLVANHNTQLSDQAITFDNERVSRQKEHEKEIEKMTTERIRLLKKQEKQHKTEHEKDKEDKENIRRQSLWYRFGTGIGFIKTE